MAINYYYIINNSFHGLQISNLNTQALLMHFIIISLNFIVYYVLESYYYNYWSLYLCIVFIVIIVLLECM